MKLTIPDVTPEQVLVFLAAPKLLDACKLALANWPFPVGAQKAKRVLEDAIAAAHPQPGESAEAKEESRE